MPTLVQVTFIRSTASIMAVKYAGVKPSTLAFCENALFGWKNNGVISAEQFDTALTLNPLPSAENPL